MFSRTLGQSRAVNLLSRAVENNRMAHAYLFSGPEGVGKKTTATQFAAILLCREEQEQPCGKCSACIQYASGNNPDFLHIRPQGATIKIDQVRTLKQEIGFPPLESPHRVILMEDVHTMRREAGNSLLKMLEEPPPDNILLLTAVDSEPLLSTIVSRCQVIPFFPLPAEIATGIITRQDPTLSPQQAQHLARLTGGCPGKACELHREGLLPAYDRITEALLDTGLSSAGKVETALELALEAAELKEGLEHLFDLLRLFFKEAMLAGLPSSSLSPDHPANAAILQARERWNLRQLSDMVQVIDFAVKALARNCNRQTVCEVLLLKLLPLSDSRADHKN